MNKSTFFIQNNHVEHLTAPVATFANSRCIKPEDRSSFQGFDANDCDIDRSGHDIVLPYGLVRFSRY